MATARKTTAEDVYKRQCQKIEDLIEYARPILNRWPPFYRYTIGEQIYLELISLLSLATKARLKYYNKTTLQELDTEKEILKALMRQANKTVFVDKKGEQRRLLSNHSYGVWAEKMVEIGKLIGGWIQSINKEKQERNRDGKD